MSASDKRAEILELIWLLNDARSTLVTEINQRVNKVTNALANEAEGLLSASLAEGGSKAIKNQQAVETMIAGMSTSKRKCSICRQPGHRAQNCPKAAEKYVADRTAPVEKTRKKRKPMTEEQRKAAVARLVKARAARGKK